MDKNPNNEDDDWEDENPNDLKNPKNSKSSKENTKPDQPSLETLTKRNVKSLVHELKRQNAFSDLFKTRKRSADEESTRKREESSSKAKRVLRTREPSKNKLTVRDLPLIEDDNESDFDFNEDEEEDSSGSMSNDEEGDDVTDGGATDGNATDHTATDCSAPNTPLNVNLEPVRTRARDTVTNNKPMSELLLEAEKVLYRIDPDIHNDSTLNFDVNESHNSFHDLMNIEACLSQSPSTFSLNDLDAKYQDGFEESGKSKIGEKYVPVLNFPRTSDPSKLITSELRRIATPKPGSFHQPTDPKVPDKYNTLMQTLTPADKLWTEFCSETFYLDDDVLQNTVGDHDTEILDPSFDYLTEQEKEARRTETVQEKEEENRSYRIMRNEVEDLKRDSEVVTVYKHKSMGECFVDMLTNDNDKFEKSEKTVSQNKVKTVSPGKLKHTKTQIIPSFGKTTNSTPNSTLNSTSSLPIKNLAVTNSYLQNKSLMKSPDLPKRFKNRPRASPRKITISYSVFKNFGPTTTIWSFF